jgi:hypothetical protein
MGEYDHITLPWCERLFFIGVKDRDEITNIVEKLIDLLCGNKNSLYFIYVPVADRYLMNIWNF